MDTPVSRSALYGKLTKSLFRSLESATTFCKLRANPYVELTHWLHQLIQQPENDIHNVLRHYQITSADVEKALIQQLNILPAGASVINDFSHHIDLSVEKAWMLASIRFGDKKIRSGWLLLAWLTTPELCRVLKNICAPLAELPVDELLDILPSLITSSPELTEMPYDGSDLNSAVPGEASQVFAGESTGSKSALAKYCQDMTALAREGNIDPVTGREHEIRTMTDILLRRRQNNPLLTGEAGVGKTAVVEGFALAIAGGEVPPSLRNVRLLSLDVGALLAGASMKGEFESRLKALLEEAARSPQPVILFVDEVHTLVGAGGTSGTGDAANLLKPALARGTLRTIGATTWSEYKRHIEKDPALMPDSAGLKEALMPELRKHFPAAFLGRVTVIPYLPLDETARGVIARLHLGRLMDRMAEQHGVSLVYGDELITHIVSRCPMHETGARLLIGYIEQHILPQLSRYWLQAMTEKTAITQIRIRVDEDEQIIFETD
ncbi:AAA family ATPase [Escherichia coli]|uniref:AAA family ATPase n=1 Tax=Escherichia coli TaxID=562 RepID=UPI000D127041|nr:AAA family ATPase [Escherichia coli]EED1927599.1 AAA family ATPase [Escherichia coli]EEU3016213.1 AAA family ATPase [Escherichia coli]EEX5382458.1 AAA family ATPase [Escherichia coli]EFL3921908.1 AAA family ATPase [Escherichia coli]EFM4167632.1 AAA family ATPase [Escherichia coli]